MCGSNFQPQGDTREIKLKYNGATACVYIRDNQLINIFRRVVHTKLMSCLFLWISSLLTFISSVGNRLRLTEIKIRDMTAHKGDTSARLMMARVCEDFLRLEEIQFVLFWLLWWWETRNSWDYSEIRRKKVKISNWEILLNLWGKLMRWFWKGKVEFMDLGKFKVLKLKIKSIFIVESPFWH